MAPAGPEGSPGQDGEPAGMQAIPVKESRIAVPAFLQEEKLLQTHLLRLVLKELSGGRKGYWHEPYQGCGKPFLQTGRKKVMLPYGLERRCAASVR